MSRETATGSPSCGISVELDGEDLAEQYPFMRAARPRPPPHRSCFDAQFNAKLALVRGDRAAAKVQADYLAERHYRNPEYLHFCQRHALCAP
jgi:hypothetical protein